MRVVVATLFWLLCWQGMVVVGGVMVGNTDLKQRCGFSGCALLVKGSLQASCNLGADFVQAMFLGKCV